jgi:hypothetical protein
MSERLFMWSSLCALVKAEGRAWPINAESQLRSALGAQVVDPRPYDVGAQLAHHCFDG